MTGPRGQVGPRIPLASLDYSPATDTVTLHPVRRLDLRQRYRLIVNGMPPQGITSTSGAYLDGLGNGTPGSNYDKIFGAGVLAGPNPGFGAGRARWSALRAAALAEPAPAWPTSPPDRIGGGRARVASAHVRIAPLVRLNPAAVDAVIGSTALFPMSRWRHRA